MKPNSSDQYTEEETIRRRDATIKRMLATPPKPHSEMKIGKSRRKARKSPKDNPSAIEEAAKMNHKVRLAP